MLIYHPAFDAYHCVFRLLAILDRKREIDVDYLRVLDFALCFPSVVADFRFPPQLSPVKRLAKDSSNLYRAPLNSKLMFINLKPAYDGALACLSAAGFVVAEELRRGNVVRTAQSLPTSLALRCARLQTSEHSFFSQIMDVLLSFPLHGENGLKDRSGLMEYRYDNV